MEGASYLQHFPKLHCLVLLAPFLDSSISMLKQLTSVRFSPAESQLPVGHSHACANLAVLQDLTNMTQLELKSTHISAVSQLEALTQLRVLKLESCHAELAGWRSGGKSAAEILHVSWKQQRQGDLDWDPTERLPALDTVLAKQGLLPSLLSAVGPCSRAAHLRCAGQFVT